MTRLTQRSGRPPSAFHVAALLAFVAGAGLAPLACNSKDPLLLPGTGGQGSEIGTGGAAGMGTGGRAAGTGGAVAGTGGAVAGTGGTVAGTGGAVAGTGGRGAGGGGAGGGGSPGTGGVRPGTGGATGTGGAGSGGTSGTGGASDGGADTRLCEQGLCTRPYHCVRACGGPIEYTGCCMCEAPLFDDYGGMACGDGGQAGVTYVGCRFVGGLDRIVVGKRDTARNLCINVVLVAPGTPPAGLTTPSPFGLEWVTAGPASNCPSRSAPPSVLRAAQVTGVVAITPPGTTAINAVSVDVTATFPSNDAGAPPAELLRASNVDVTAFCSP